MASKGGEVCDVIKGRFGLCCCKWHALELLDCTGFQWLISPDIRVLSEVVSTLEVAESVPLRVNAFRVESAALGVRASLVLLASVFCWLVDNPLLMALDGKPEYTGTKLGNASRCTQMHAREKQQRPYMIFITWRRKWNATVSATTTICHRTKEPSDWFD